jgi:hypothetical protein
MPEPLDLDEILARNAQIDREHLEETQEMLQHLRERGAHRKGYDLAPPGGGRRATIRSNARTNPGLLRVPRDQEVTAR